MAHDSAPDPDETATAEPAVLGAPDNSTDDPQTPITTAVDDDRVALGPEMAQTDAITKKRTTKQQAVAFIAAIEAGIPARQAATDCGINIRTAYGVLARMDSDIEGTRNAVVKLLQVEALERLDDWRTASRIGALKKGNHSPAKEWLLHAGIIDSLQSDAGTNVRIAICIGTDEQPMKIASPLHIKDE